MGQDGFQMPGERGALMISCAIIRRETEILLVRQRDKDATIKWGLPGGAAEDDEVLLKTLAREVREETGLKVIEPGPMAYAAEISHPHVLAFVFEVIQWSGDLLPADPDNDILEAAFMPVESAIQRLSRQPPHFVRTPLSAYLRGTVGPGALLVFRRDDAGDHLVEQTAVLRGQ
jgi:ADP-ribose pyrophosphatase YjhB (NUDIX family)